MKTTIPAIMMTKAMMAQMKARTQTGKLVRRWPRWTCGFGIGRGGVRVYS
ncbi:hypothetical protein Hanom_Chr03g00258801 [Helianthus anomalus]